MGNNPNGNIFFNLESLAFAMPLILLCSGYAYFKFIPLTYGLPVLGGLGAIFFMKAQVQKTRETKLQNLDEDTIQDLVGDEDDTDSNDDAKKKNDNKKVKVQKRLAAEKKKAISSKKKKGGDDNADADDDDDVDALMTFAKGGAKTKKR